MIEDANEIMKPDRLSSVAFNVRVHRQADDVFRRLYAKFYPTKHKYTQAQLMTIAILLLNKQIKKHKIKGGDDIAEKLGVLYGE